MPIRVVRLGNPRSKDEGLRIGTVRRPPRGVKKADYAKRNFYDVWLPELAPTAPLISALFAKPASAKHWAAFERKYRAEMRKPEPERLLTLLAALSRKSNFSVGCYCEDESRCHRSILRKLLKEHGAVFTQNE